MRIPLERCIASIFVALSVVLVFLALSQLLNLPSALFLSLAYAFCTSAWSNASRGLWAHAPVMLLYALTLYLFLRARTQTNLLKYTALPLALSYIVRPTSAVAILTFSVFIWYCYRREFLKFVLLLTLPLALFSLSSLLIYGQYLPHYFRASRLAFHAALPEAMLGNLLSPARGVFILSPFLIFCIVGILIGTTSKDFKAFSYALALTIMLHLFSVSMLPTWWGGHCFGARYMADVLPFMFFFLALLIANLARFSKSLRAAFYLVFICALFFSAYVHYRGANQIAVYSWNMSPRNVDYAPKRVWDWTDLQFKR